MRLRDFKIGWRQLAGDPVYSLAVVLGLSVGFAVSFLLLGFVHYSFSYDSQVPDADEVYVLKHRLNILAQPHWSEMMPGPAKTAALRSGLVSQATMVIWERKVAKSDNRLVPLALSRVDADFPALFGVRAVEGDLAAVIARPEGLALTQTAALR